MVERSSCWVGRRLLLIILGAVHAGACISEPAELDAEDERFDRLRSAEESPTCHGLPPTGGCTVDGVPGQLCVGSDVVGTPGADVIIGTEGNDLLRGKQGKDTICGLSGDDELRGGMGADTIDGGEGHDLIVGGKNAVMEQLDGGPGDDIIDGRTSLVVDTTLGMNVLVGGLGYDTCFNSDISVDCESETQSDGVCSRNPDELDCDGLCHPGDRPDSADCDGVCDPGDEVGSPDCDGQCGEFDAADSGDCDGLCGPGDHLLSEDCTGGGGGDTGWDDCWINPHCGAA